MLAMLAQHTRALVLVLKAVFLIQLPDNVPWKMVEDDSATWVPANHMGDQDGHPGFWLCPEAEVGVKAVLKVSFAQFLSHYAFQIMNE